MKTSEEEFDKIMKDIQRLVNVLKRPLKRFKGVS